MPLVGSSSSLGGLSGGNVLARLAVVVSGDTRPLQSTLAATTASVQSFQRQIITSNAEAIRAASVANVRNAKGQIQTLQYAQRNAQGQIVKTTRAVLSEAEALAIAQRQGITFGQKLSTAFRGVMVNSQALGSAMIRSITLPILGISAVSVKMAMDYQAAMARVRAITRLNGAEFQKASKQIMEIAQELPTPPLELANSLYFAGSAGLSFGQAMDVVKFSAGGAAIGMGDANEMARVLIYALNAFADQGLTAAHAMDVLVAAVKEGTAEPSDLAISLGRLLPIADEAGISFDTVAASVAQLTNAGLPARVSVTALRALFVQLLAPTKQAEQELNQFGITAAELRQALEAGPISAFLLLQNRLRGAGVAEEDMIEPTRRIIAQIRGLTAYLDLSGPKLGEYAQIIDKVKNSQGMYNRVLATFQKTAAFKAEMAVNKLRIAAIQLGGQMIPIFLRVMGVVANVGTTFSDLGGGSRKLVTALMLIAAAGGPLIRIFGLMTNNGEGMFTSFKSGAVSIMVAAAAAGVAVAGFSQLTHGTLDLGTAAKTAIASLIAARIAIGGLVKVAQTVGIGTGFIGMLAKLKSPAMMAVAVGIAAVTVAIGYFIGQSHKAAKAAGDMQRALIALGPSSELTRKRLVEAGKGSQDLADAIVSAARRANALGRPLLEGLGQTLVQINKDLLQGALRARPAVAAMVDPERLKTWDRGIAVLRGIQGQAVSVGTAFRGSNVNLANFEEISRSLGGLAAAGGKGLEALATGSDAVGNAMADLNATMQFQIAMHVKGKQAVADLSRQTGLSASFIESSLSGVSVSLDEYASMSDETGQAALVAAGLYDDAKNTYLTAADEMMAKDAELTAKRQESMTSAFKLFDDLPEHVKKSTEELVRQAEKQANMYEQMTQDTQTLLSRGLDPDVLQALVDQGPMMVSKFVNASGKQLNRLETAYHVTLGAIDAAIVEEGLHQEGKADNMTRSFAEALYSNRRLPVGAMRGIVQSVIAAIDTHKMGKAGQNLILSFANSLTAPGGMNLAGQAAAEIMTAVTNGLISGHLDKAGVQSIIAFGQGLQDASGVPKRIIGRMVMDFTTYMTGGKFEKAGASTIQSYVQGLINEFHLPGQTAKAIAQAAADSLGLHVDISFKKGKLIVTKLVEGMTSQQAPAVSAAARIGDIVAQRLKSGDTAYKSGVAVGHDFVLGLTSQLAPAQQAAIRMGELTAAALKRSLQGSPKYFSYYAGRDVMTQFGEGLRSRNIKGSLPHLGVDGPSASGTGQLHIISGVVDTPMGPANVRMIAREEDKGRDRFRERVGRMG